MNKCSSGGFEIGLLAIDHHREQLILKALFSNRKVDQSALSENFGLIVRVLQLCLKK